MSKDMKKYIKVKIKNSSVGGGTSQMKIEDVYDKIVANKHIEIESIDPKDILSLRSLIDGVTKVKNYTLSPRLRNLTKVKLDHNINNLPYGETVRELNRFFKDKNYDGAFEEKNDLIHNDPDESLENYTVTFYDIKGSNISNIIFTKESQDITLPNLNSEGSIFVGWYDEFGNLFTVIKKGTKKNIKLHSVWENAFYNINYDLDGGENDDYNPSTYTFGEGVDYFYPPYKEGYRFIQWSQNNIPRNNIGEVTLIAEWGIEEYEVYFSGLDFYLPSITYNINTPTFTLPIPDPGEDWIFEGWRYFNNYINDYESISEIPKGATEYIYAEAVLTPVDHSITFNVNGGNPIDSITYNRNNRYQINIPIPVRDDYSFTYWYLDENFETAFTSMGSMSGSFTLYAKWYKSSFSVTYHLDGGINDPSNKDTYNFAFGGRVSLYHPSKESYIFKGWYDNPEFIGEEITHIHTEREDDLVLYAKWNIMTLNISFYINNIIQPDMDIATTADQCPIVLEPLDRPGHDNSSWRLNTSNGILVSVIESHMIPYNLPTGGYIKIYASSIPHTYNISYNLNGGTGTMNPKTYTVGETVNFTGNVTRSGYRLIGYEPEFISYDTIGDITVDLMWEELAFNVSFQIGSEIVETVTLKHSDPLYYIKMKPEIEDMVFIGWYYQGNRSNPPSVVINPAALTEDVLYVAIFDEYNENRYYNIFYESENQIYGTVAQYRPIDGYELITPYRLGAIEFLGWYEDPSFTGEPVTNLPVGTFGNKKFYAKWRLTSQVYESSTNGVILDTEGEIWVSGDDGPRISGNSQASTILPSWTKQVMPEGLRFKKLAYRDRNFLGLTSDGEVWMYGNYNSLGDLNYTQYTKSNISAKVVDISINYNAAFALDEDNNLYAIGKFNGSGAAAVGGLTRGRKKEWVKLDNPPFVPKRLFSSDRTSFIEDENGVLYATGSNENNQSGTSLTSSTITRWTPVVGVSNVKQLIDVFYYVLFVGEDNNLYAAGNNMYLNGPASNMPSATLIHNEVQYAGGYTNTNIFKSSSNKQTWINGNTSPFYGSQGSIIASWLLMSELYKYNYKELILSNSRSYIIDEKNILYVSGNNTNNALGYPGGGVAQFKRIDFMDL